MQSPIVSAGPKGVSLSALPRPLILGFGGTASANSSSERVLRFALSIAEERGAQIDLVAGRDLELPPYDPARGALQDRALKFVNRLRRADALIISSAAYHGAISGTLKNAIDYAEDLRSDDQPYLEGKAVGSIVCAQGAQALGSTLANMRSIVHALRGWNTPYAVTVNTADKPFNDVGFVTDAISRQIEIMTQQVVDFAMTRVIARAVRARAD